MNTTETPSNKTRTTRDVKKVNKQINRNLKRKNNILKLKNIFFRFLSVLFDNFLPIFITICVVVSLGFNVATFTYVNNLTNKLDTYQAVVDEHINSITPNPKPEPTENPKPSETPEPDMSGGDATDNEASNPEVSPSPTVTKAPTTNNNGGSNSNNNNTNPSGRPVMNLSAQELYVVESLVAGEAGNQPYKGMQAVAQCIMNAMLKDKLTPSQVRSQYKYSGWHDINKFYSANPTQGQLVKDAVASVFFRGETVTDAYILWFCNPSITGRNNWHFTQNLIMEIDDHAFFAPWNYTPSY